MCQLFVSVNFSELNPWPTRSSEAHAQFKAQIQIGVAYLEAQLERALVFNSA